LPLPMNPTNTRFFIRRIITDSASVGQANELSGYTKRPGWKDHILRGDCRKVLQTLPDRCASRHHVGLDYDGHNDRMPYDEYLTLLLTVWQQVHRVLADCGRFVLNIEPTSIKDFGPIHYDMAAQPRALGFIMRTEIIQLSRQ